MHEITGVPKVNIGPLVSFTKLSSLVTIGSKPRASLLPVPCSGFMQVYITPASPASAIGAEGGIAKPDVGFVGVGRERAVVEGAIVCVSVTMTVSVCLTNEEYVEKSG